MRLMGIDPGSTLQNPTGYAVLETEQDVVLTYGLIKPRGEDHFGCLVRLFNRLLTDLSEQHSPAKMRVCIEAPYLGRNAGTTIKLAELVGAYRALCCLSGYAVQEIVPAQAKAALAGVGNASKTQMIDAARLRYGLALPSHVADAIGIALAGVTWEGGDNGRDR